MARWKPRDPLQEFQPLFDFLYTPLTEKNYRDLLLGVCPLFWRELEQPSEYPAVGFKDPEPTYGDVMGLQQTLRGELDQLLKTENAYQRIPAFTWENILRVPMLNLSKLMAIARSGSGYRPLKRCPECHRPFAAWAKRTKSACSPKCRDRQRRKIKAPQGRAAREKHPHGTSRA